MFNDGRGVPASGPPDAVHLSGGEQVQLAIAFRFASYYMFANKFGLLCLDEPTAHLDDRNIGRFCDLIVQAKKLAVSMDLQIIISSHHRELIPFADTVIDLGTK
jgi:DNA repair exonuclease SbcCD ATPase subunit